MIVMLHESPVLIGEAEYVMLLRNLKLEFSSVIPEFVPNDDVDVMETDEPE